MSYINTNKREQSMFDQCSLLCKDDECTACLACQAKCPREAITIYTNEYGYTFPQINKQKCINCGVCTVTCPQMNTIDYYMPYSCFAAQTNDKKKAQRSASGGIGAIIAQKSIEKGYVVFGCGIINGVPKHIIANNLCDIEQFQGSKYVQSNMDGTIKNINKCLKNGTKVVFFGTPCQVAGVRSALKGIDEQLYCIDIICHGVPPYTYLQSHLKKVTKKETMDTYSFRGGANDYFLTVVADKKIVYRKDRIRDSYFYAFMKGINLRNNCYNCHYTQKKRVGDLTIGDFWGLDRKTMKTHQNGRISVVLLNTNKGSKVWNAIADDLIWEERQIEEAVNGNDRLRNPIIKPSCKEEFEKKYYRYKDFDKAFLRCGIKKKWYIDRLKHNTIAKKARRILNKTR